MSDLKITKGNTFHTILEVKAYRYDGKEIKDFDLSNCTDIAVKCRINGVIREVTNFKFRSSNEIEIHWDSVSKPGSYSIEITGRLGLHKWRYYSKNPIFTIVETTQDQNIPEEAVLKTGTYYVGVSKIYLIPVEGSEIKIDQQTGHWIVAGVDTGVSAKGPKGDRGEKGDTGDVIDDYTKLKNTPNFSTVAYTGDYDDLYNKPTIQNIQRLSQLMNDVGFVTSGNVSNNYYNKTQVDSKIEAINSTIEDNEHVVSAALNDLNARIVDILTSGLGEDNMQADWNQTDSSADDYIKNKPTLLSTFKNDLKSFTYSYNWSDLDTLVDRGVYIVGYNSVVDDDPHTYSDGNSKQVHVICVDTNESRMATIKTYATQRDITLNLQRSKLVSGGEITDVVHYMEYNEQTGEYETYVIYNGQRMSAELYDRMVQNQYAWSDWTPLYVKSDWNETNTYSFAYIKNKPTKLSDFTNDVLDITNYYTKALIDAFGFLTQHQDISGKADSSDVYTKSQVYTKAEVDAKITNASSGGTVDLSNYYNKQEVDDLIPTIPSNVSAFTNDAGYLTQHQDISGKANTADFATVATSGSYNDLSNKPTIPDANTVASWGFVKGTSNPFALNGPIQSLSGTYELLPGYNFLVKSSSDSSTIPAHIGEEYDLYKEGYGMHVYEVISEFDNINLTVSLTYWWPSSSGGKDWTVKYKHLAITFSDADSNNPVMFRIFIRLYNNTESNNPLVLVVPITNDSGFTYSELDSWSSNESFPSQQS